MIKQEFKLGRETALRAQTRSAYRLIACTIGLVLVIVITARPLIEHLQESGFFDRVLGIPRSVVFAVGGMGLLLFAWVVSLTREVTSGVRCPSCDKPLLGIGGELARLTGNCSRCGERIIEDFEESAVTAQSKIRDT